MLALIILLWLCVWFIILQFKSRRPKNFPPGPPALPLLGNLLQINLQNPLNDFERLRETYGNVFSLFFGTRPVVVLNGMKAIKEALVNKAVDFAGRPGDLMGTALTRETGLILENYGTVWRDHRRFALTTLRNFGMGKKSMEEKIHEEVQHTINELEKNSGKILNPQNMFHNISFNIICQVLFARRYDYGDNLIKDAVRCFTENAQIINGPWSTLYDSVPLIRNLPLPFKRAFENNKTVADLVADLMKEHKKVRVPGDPQDYMDCYLDEIDKRGSEGSAFSEQRLLGNALDLNFAGTDTTANTLRTAFLYLMAHPHIQERCLQEIDEILEGKSRVEFEDRNYMPYVQAVIHEVQRLANTVPLSVIHATSKDTELMGFVIPKGTMVIPNLTTVLDEEGQWKFPQGFHPENFLNDDGEFVKPEAFIPFSAGPRICVGEGLARMELFLIVVTLLRKFKFIWPEEDGEPDFTPIFGFTIRPKPYRMKVQLRAT